MDCFLSEMRMISYDSDLLFGYLELFVSGYLDRARSSVTFECLEGYE